MRRFRPSRATLLYVLYLAGVALAGGYLLLVGQRSWAAYSFLKSDHLGFRGRVHQADAELGFAAVPDADGFHVFPVGPPIPMRYDEEGFRVPAGLPTGQPRRRPLVMALGCSFTYGDGCRAEDVYPHLVAQDLGGTALNAGKCAYGLSQMLLLARKLVPAYRPDYLLVQFSTWLPGRGTSGFARATFGRVPVPFLLLAEDGSASVHAPVFRTRVFDLPFHEFDNRRRGAGEFARFFTTAALPLFVHDDLQMAAYAVRRALGRLPEEDQQRAQDRREDLNRAVYAEIGRLAAASGSRMVIVRLSHPLERHWQRLKELSPGALVVNAQAALDAHVPSGSRDEYYRRFGHWRGDPPRFIDNHPNPAAHRVIADEVVRAIREARPAAPAPPR
ncbi:MAG TPA: hypothetical protein VIG50_00785 [Vicinamibacteria bacterium]